MKKGWKKIDDGKVTTIWKATCNCPAMVEIGEVEMLPCDFAEAGIPICPECGQDFDYIETRIKV